MVVFGKTVNVLNICFNDKLNIFKNRNNLFGGISIACRSDENGKVDRTEG